MIGCDLHDRGPREGALAVDWDRARRRTATLEPALPAFTVVHAPLDGTATPRDARLAGRRDAPGLHMNIVVPLFLLAPSCSCRWGFGCWKSHRRARARRRWLFRLVPAAGLLVVGVLAAGRTGRRHPGAAMARRDRAVAVGWRAGVGSRPGSFRPASGTRRMRPSGSWPSGRLRGHRPPRPPAVRVLGHDHPAHGRPFPLRGFRPPARRCAGVGADPAAGSRPRSAPSSSASRSRP